MSRGPVRSRARAGVARRVVARVGLVIALALGTIGATTASAAEPRLVFVDAREAGGRERVLTLGAMQAACPERTVEVDDPYHERRMRYRALPLVCVLDLGFADSGGAAGQSGHGLLLRALDGYTRPVSGRDLISPDVFLAFGEPDPGPTGDGSPHFSPIDRRGVDPSPFYMVWTGVDRNDPHEHPWPYQLARIEVADFAEAFPHTVPSGLDEADPGWRGYALFRQSCASCHAINGEGGRVGPDLNVPRSIVEYRPIPQIRAYVRDPRATRYTSMPAHPGLTDADLDALIAYFRAMSERKHDPHGGGSAS
ncbi:MAG TPA: cytochrome c [Myxococcota bacterium]|nr:cytochrome c [Myxococcales bacterium]HPG24263.1 cytochrome c [Myxococcota bacterium]